MEKKSRREAVLNLSHMPFRFPIDFMFLTQRPCDSLGRQRKLTMGLEQDFSPFSLFLIHLCFCCPHLGGQSKQKTKM
jgi:hypothetical protein